MQPQSQQANVDMDVFWGGMGGKASQGGAEKFDSFANFFPTSNPPAQPKPAPNDMYDYFFSSEEQGEKPKNSATSTQNQTNLLDL